MPHIWTRHATFMNESCHTYKWVMSHTRMSHAAFRISHIKHTNKLYQKHGRILSHVQITHISSLTPNCALHCVAECCRVLQCVAKIGQRTSTDMKQKCALQCVAMCYRILQCVAVCCSVLQCVAACCSVLQYFAVCCNVLQNLRAYQHRSQIWDLCTRQS